MAGAERVAGTRPASAAARALPTGAGGWRAFLAIFAGVVAVSFASYLVVVGMIEPFTAAGLRHAAVISLLMGLALATQRVGPTWLSLDLEALAPLLPEGDATPSPDTAYERAPLARRAWIALGAVIGMAVVFASSGGERLTLLSPSPAWALAANALLFALMARVAWRQRAEERFLDREVTARLRVPLLHHELLSPYARRGLRGSFFWFVGSTIASVLIFNWGFSPVTLVVVLCTLALGTFSLVDPSRRLRRRVQRAKREELRRVRAAIEDARRAALAASGSEAAARLPGLLAWEARVAGIHEWPFDVATWLRFGVLALVAVGSWLGGALVERILGLALD